MLTANYPAYEYQVGGSLPLTAASYVTRQADEDLYWALTEGDFCYVLSARQMGKSSLRLRAMHRLQRSGTRSGVIDMTMIGSQRITLEQWYASILQGLVSSFKLPISLPIWWGDRAHLSPIKRFSDFLETVLLAEIDQPIVIFIDEIDSVLTLDFAIDDFFALIRACYNQRTEQPAYRRLTFALLGVTTPSDLIADKNRTPFNIGRAITLKGFQLKESLPLLPGLSGIVHQPETLLHAVLDWTGGQPFLTQKLCQLILEACQSKSHPIPVGQERAWLESLVGAKVINYWEIHDDPEHLRTIAHRLLYDEQQAGRLLGLYQNLLTSPTPVPANDSREQVELLLSGLVIKEQGHLKVCNRIYQSVFNAAWVEQQLANLRPYANSLKAWQQSDCQDDSWLLQGQALKNAQIWAEVKSLGDLDYRFLAASQKSAQHKLQLITEAERSHELQARLKQEQKTAKLQRYFLGVVGMALMLTTGLGLFAFQEYRKASMREIQAVARASEALFASEHRLEALVEAIRARRKLVSLGGSDAQLAAQVESSLRQAAYGVVEHNQFLGHQQLIYSMAISPDGQMLASASRDGTAKLWAPNGKLLHTLSGHGDWVTDVKFSPNSQMVVTASKDKTLKLWRRDGRLLRTLTGHSDLIFRTAISLDGQLIASASFDGTVKLWTITGRLVRTFKHHRGQVWSIAFSPNGQLIASGGADNAVKVFALDGRLVQNFQEHHGLVQTIAFSPDGQTIASGSRDMTVKLWRLDGHLLHTYQGHRDEILKLVFNSDGTSLASSSSDGTVQLWQPDGTLLTTLEKGGDRAWGIAFSPNGKWLASGSTDGKIKLWQLRDRLVTHLNGHQDWAVNVAFSPDGQLLASTSPDQTVKLWTPTGQLRRTLRGSHDTTIAVAFSPDSQLIAAGTEMKGNILLWKPDGKLIATLAGHRAGVFGLAFSPNGKLLASASFDKTIKLWRPDGTLIKTLNGHQREVVAVKFSPNGQQFATASWDGSIKLWRSDGSLIRTVVKGLGELNDLAFSPEGQKLVSTHRDGTLKIWTLDGKLIRTLTGHQSQVRGIAVSPNGEMLASVSQDKTIKLWHWNGTLLATLKAHSNMVSGIAFSPHSRLLASAGWDRKVILWDLDRVVDLDRVLQFSCDWVKDYLSANPQVSDRASHDGADQLCNNTSD